MWNAARQFERGVISTCVVVFKGAMVVAVVLISALGARRTVAGAVTAATNGLTHPVGSFVRSTVTDGDTYLMPIDLEWFRTETGAPIFVDWKTHPYKDREVLEWYERVNLARKFYASKTAREAEDRLNVILTKSAISRIVVPRHWLLELPAGRYQVLYEDGDYRVLGLKEGLIAGR